MMIIVAESYINRKCNTTTILTVSKGEKAQGSVMLMVEKKILKEKNASVL